VAAARSAKAVDPPVLMVYVPVPRRPGGAPATGDADGIVFARVSTSVLMAEDLAGSTPLALRLTVVDAGDGPIGTDGRAGKRQLGVGTAGRHDLLRGGMVFRLDVAARTDLDDAGAGVGAVRVLAALTGLADETAFDFIRYSLRR
jgi:hypothetical protein